MERYPHEDLRITSDGIFTLVSSADEYEIGLSGWLAVEDGDTNLLWILRVSGRCEFLSGTIKEGVVVARAHDFFDEQYIFRIPVENPQEAEVEWVGPEPSPEDETAPLFADSVGELLELCTERYPELSILLGYCHVQEISAAQFLADVHFETPQLIAEDMLFSYRCPEDSLSMARGRRGYLIVRDELILADVVVAPNPGVKFGKYVRPLYGPELPDYEEFSL